MPDIDALIATLPTQIQNNALTAAETGIDQQKLQQNALAMQENQAGQNALRQIYGNRANINNQTGFPNPNTLTPLAQANPDMYLRYLDTMGKIQDSQSRTNLTNFKLRDEQNQIIIDNVGKPTAEYAQELEDKGIAPDQRKIMVQQKYKELLDNTANEYGLSDNIKNTAAGVDVDSIPQRIEMNNLRQKNIEQGWQKQTDYGKNPPVEYYHNKFLNIDTDITQKNPYTPTGVAEPKGKIAPIQTDTFTNDKGQIETKPFTRDAFGRPINPNTQEPYTVKGSVSSSSKTDTGGLGPTEQIRVSTPNGGEKVISAQPIKNRLPGQPAQYFDEQGKLVDPKTILGAKLPSSVAGPEYSDAAVNILADQALTGDPAALRSVFGGQNLRVQVMNRVAERAKELWGPDAGANLAAVNAMFSSQEGALRGLTKLRANVGSFEQTALREADLASQLSEKGLYGEIPVLNRWIQAGRKSIKGDDDVTALDTAVTSLTNEYARIMSSPGATGGQTSDTARGEAAKLLNDAQTPEQFKHNIDIMRTSMANRMKAIDDQVGSTLSEIKGAGGVSTPLQPPNPAPKSEPTPGTTNKLAIGKTSYTSVHDVAKDLPNKQYVIINNDKYGRDDKGNLYKNGKMIKLEDLK